MKIIVTGGAGFIGSHLVNELCNQGHEVHVIDDMSSGKVINPRAYNHKIDIREILKYSADFWGTEIVYHLAAIPRVQYSINEPLITGSVNVDGTLQMLELSKRLGVKKFIFASSSSVYGNAEKFPINEEVDLNPMSPYAAHKMMGEIYCKIYSEVYKLPTLCARFFNVYGPGQSADSEYACVIPRFISKWKKGEALSVTGDGEQSRDFTHVKDVVRGLIMMAENASLGFALPINLGCGSPVSINTIADLIGGQKTYLPARLEPRKTQADITRARIMLGWTPQIGIMEGISGLKLYAENKSGQLPGSSK